VYTRVLLYRMITVQQSLCTDGRAHETIKQWTRVVPTYTENELAISGCDVTQIQRALTAVATTESHARRSSTISDHARYNH
jgi:hypothetical protein